MQRSEIAGRLAQIHERIARACARAGRSPAEVTLVAVSKTVSPDRIRAALEAGVKVLGENRVQEAAAKIPELREVTENHQAAWHLIGHLQSNKARRAVELFDAVESVDSLELGERLDRVAAEMNKRLPVFVQVNIGSEGSKSGLAAEAVLPVCERLGRLSHLELRGLMTIPPLFDDPEEARPFFRRLRELRDEVRRAGFGGEQFRDLSMGMSHDFEIAIEEGATLVRIGTAIFGARH
ncbi:MAG TPA: YggS family pyridoxal phosphate-dependent enzyme [Blastocatellia bacterium]|nr:YggS family pyridoxal phosphate-dependent enzyme [Blastocatellia bacterium]